MYSNKIHRNELCACGSGRKYKRCCMSAANASVLHAESISLPVEELIETAMSHHRAGQLSQAETLYRQVLEIQPQHPDALHLLGAIAHQQRDHDTAHALISAAIAAEPNVAMHDNLGLVLQAKGDLEGAAASFRRALELDPNHVNAYNNLGVVLKDQGKHAEAMQCFLQALSLKPDYAGAYCNLGITAFEQGHLPEAVRCFETALQLEPASTIAYYNLGNAFRELGQYDAAIQAYEKLLALEPNNVLGRNNLGNVLRDRGSSDEAVAEYRKVLALDPNLEYAYSNMLYAMLKVPTYSLTELFAEHVRFGQQFEAQFKPIWPQHGNSRDPLKRLRIGYVSGDFREHAVTYFFEPVLAQHDKSQVEVFCYYNHHQHDEFTRRFAALSDHWLSCKGMSDEALSERILADGIDILVDLSGHTAHHRLLTFARKPAPVQMSWIGYPYTTGLSAIDYRLTDALQDPPDLTERYHSETLLRLPTASQFKPVAIRPPINALPALSQDIFTFACLNSLSKTSEDVLELWAHILLAVPQSRLMLGNVNDEPTRQKLLEVFSKHGIAQERLVMHAKMSLYDYLALHQQIDLALDPFPYTGGTTTYHALSMGVPVITLTGDSPVTRCGAAIMANAGLSQFVASSKEQYVERAIAFTHDLPALNQVRQALRQGTPNLYDPQTSTYAQELEKLFRQAWKKWCAQ